MAAILKSAILNLAILDSDTLLSSLRFTQKHSHSTLTLTQTNSIWLTWRWQPSWNLLSWIWPSWIQTPCYLLSDSLKNILTPLWLWLKLIQSDSTHSFSLYLMMTANLNSAILNLTILDSDTLLSSLRFTQKHSHSTLTLTQTNSIWLSWRWQPSWNLLSWIWPSWFQPS